MRRLFYTACLVVLASPALFAQQPDYPEADFTAAFAAARMEQGVTFYGYTAAAAFNLNRNFAIEGDFTCITVSAFGTCANVVGSLQGPPDFTTTRCESGTCANMIGYMGGLRYSVRPYVRRFQPFAHVLVGGSRFSSRTFRDSGWAGKLGGGLDIAATKHIAVRVFQMDYCPTHFSAGDNDKVAFTFGVRFN